MAILAMCSEEAFLLTVFVAECPDMLPIEAIRTELLDAVAAPGCCVLLSAPTGSGKSTRVPLMMMEAGWGERGTIIVVQPRRLAARLLAGYVARQFPCTLGQEVGYAVRFDVRRSAATRILFMTDGLLERRLMDDPTLSGVSAVIFDEVHERRLSGDLCLARVLQLQRGERPDIGVVVMSATLELDKLQSYLPQARVLRAEGRLYPVELAYRPAVPVRDRFGRVAPPPIWEQCAAAVKELVTRPESGDILVFLPGAYEIRRTVEILEATLRGRDVFALHGQLTPELQAQAVECGERSRVIVSTNIAETSLTIEGVRSVVDCGTAREARWDPVRGLSTLHIVPISQAQAEQRAGRAGRLGPGICIRLWSEAEQRRRLPFPSPEVHRADISMAFLSLMAWGCRTLADIRHFPWPDAPTEAETERAWQLLCDLGAIEPGGGLSSIGRRMMHYPLPPVLARLLVSGVELDCEPEAAAIAALLQGEPVAMAQGLSEKLYEEGDFSDFQAEWRAVQEAARLRYAPEPCSRLGIMARAAREIATAYRQFSRGSAQPDFAAHEAGVAAALLGSFPRHVAARNSTATATARLTGRRGGVITQTPVTKSSDLFLAAEMTEVGGKAVETRLARCTRLAPEALPTQEDEVALYDSRRKRVLTYRRTLYLDLVINEQELGDASPEAAAPLLADELIHGRIHLEHWNGHVEQWIHRLSCLRAAMPELELPEFGEEERLLALTLLCEGAVSAREVAERQVLPILHDWLSPWQRQALDQYAPRALRLTNGREVKLIYREDGTPSFALRSRDLMGVETTPTLPCGVPCLIEVLAPNFRPYQLTQDLASFWKTGYPQMKKDLGGRYPKHF